jgi:hypothetical protein
MAQRTRVGDADLSRRLASFTPVQKKRITGDYRAMFSRATGREWSKSAHVEQ